MDLSVSVSPGNTIDSRCLAEFTKNVNHFIEKLKTLTKENLSISENSDFICLSCQRILHARLTEREDTFLLPNVISKDDVGPWVSKVLHENMETLCCKSAQCSADLCFLTNSLDQLLDFCWQKLNTGNLCN